MIQIPSGREIDVMPSIVAMLKSPIGPLRTSFSNWTTCHAHLRRGADPAACWHQCPLPLAGQSWRQSARALEVSSG